MTIREGLYKVHFETPLGAGFGVAYLAGGRINGGDSMMAYTGTYSENGDQIEAEVNSFQHSVVQGMTSAIGTDKGTIKFSGKANGNAMELSGKMEGAPIDVGANLVLIA